MHISWLILPFTAYFHFLDIEYCLLCRSKLPQHRGNQGDNTVQKFYMPRTTNLDKMGLNPISNVWMLCKYWQII